MEWTPEMMPGPDIARELQVKQWTALNAYYEAYNAVTGGEATHEHPTVTAALNAYNQTVEALVALLGPDAHCNQVDCSTWSLFSDCHKDRAGFRPRTYYSLAQVNELLERWKTEPLEDDDFD